MFALGLGKVCFGGLCLKPSAPVSIHLGYFSIHFGNTSVFAPTYTAVFSIHTPLSGVSTLMAQHVERVIVPLEVPHR